MDVSKRIRRYRQYLHMTQEELASKANINEKYYGRIERGESCPTIEYVIKICDAMEIDIIELFMYNPDLKGKEFKLNPRVTQTIVRNFQHDVDVHFNRDMVYNNCEKSIWYYGFIGSMNFDEFGFLLYAAGNIKGVLYRNFHVVLELNSNNVFNELKKYVNNDEELMQLIEYMPYNEEILKEKGGDAFFVEESNWLTAKLVNNGTGEIIFDDIILDTDNIIECFGDRDMLFNYIFLTGK